MPFAPERPQVDLAGAEKLGNEVRWIEVSPAYYEAIRKRLRAAWWIPLAIILAIAGSIYFVFGLQVLEDSRIRLKVFVVVVALLAHAAYLPFAGRFAGREWAGYRLGASTLGL